MQLVIIGKIAAGILLATAAYRPPEEFKGLTGIEEAQLLQDPVTHTTVRGSGKICTVGRIQLYGLTSRRSFCGAHQPSARQCSCD